MIRDAKLSDTQRLLDIYRPYIEESAVSFETTVPSIQDFGLRIEENLKTFPWLVLEKERTIIGYAYAGQFHSRSAYSWSVESSVYVAKEFQRQGVGRELYNKLFDILKMQGVVNVFAGATLPNIGSVRLHERLGFKHIGVYKKVGFKFEKWWDVGWWQLEFQRPSIPSKIIPYLELHANF